MKAFLKKVYNILMYRDSIEYFWKIRNKANNSRNPFSKYWNKNKYNKYVEKKNAFIPANIEIDRSVIFPHGICGVFISSGAKIGKNCVIFHQVTIGSNTLKGSKGEGAPTLGNNVYIGCGAKIIGNVVIGDNVRIGANCVITKDVEPNSTVVLENPRIIVKNEVQNNTFVKFEDAK